ncbi:transglutaminase domain-containing protein [Lichenihabitans sp. Uapishka_5]|uniref:transglutaminase-like domain-containing protein n=1 Tax=Lichenihabitans sp. Uapishka_5 TaxID=3037302 RepID=UPI0029E7FC0C|nr:transglutaminase domain-containing protein [Lichenihabitans sp. Uapishka_5]MDX7951514.1 transglutaminase domain-containing protein [Lichenihabitans sp. Uapishka_5]
MISRRHLLATAGAGLALAALPGSLLAAFAETPTWRRFRVTTRLDVAADGAAAQAWMPLAGVSDADWVRVVDNQWSAAPGATVERHQTTGADLLHVRWGDGPRRLTVVSTVETRDRALPMTTTGDAIVLPEAARSQYLRGTALAPVDGIVRQTALAITAGAADDLGKARALYAWVVSNTFREASVQGCGDGNVLRMLETGHLGGKCADINPLFVALCRAAGLPARDLYGIRVAPSRLGYASLGPKTADVTKAQHCRAEVFLDGLGWTAMDPADVRKVMLEEVPGGLGADAPKVEAARARLFGAWEGNWIPFNAGNDVTLPGSARATDAFLMYPQVERAADRLDCTQPQQARYTIGAEELAI